MGHEAPARNRQQSFTTGRLTQFLSAFNLFQRPHESPPNAPPVANEQKIRRPYALDQNLVPFTIEHLCFLKEGTIFAYRTLYDNHRKKCKKALMMTPSELSAQQTIEQNLKAQQQLITHLTALFNERLSLAYKQADFNENDTSQLFALYEDAIELVMNAKAHALQSHGEKVSKHHYMKENAEREFKAYIKGVLAPFAYFADEHRKAKHISENPNIQQQIESIRRKLSKDGQNACQNIVNNMKDTLITRQFRCDPFQGYTSLRAFIQTHYPSNCHSSDVDPQGEIYQKVTVALTREALNLPQTHKAAADTIEQTLSKADPDVMIHHDVIEYILPQVKLLTGETWATKCAQLIVAALHTRPATQPEIMRHEEESTRLFSH